MSEEREAAIRTLLARFDAPPDAAHAADEYFMDAALSLAAHAAGVGEVPIGAVLVRGGRILTGDYNGREGERHALYHAELGAIDRACRLLGAWRLSDCTLYVTVEPCPMCAGAVWNARIGRVVFGAREPSSGAFGSLLQLNSYPLGWKPALTAGVRAEESRALLGAFFAARRKKKIAAVVCPPARRTESATGFTDSQSVKIQRES